MVYGDSKVRTMVRSLLPSTGRRPARQSKAIVARATRRSIRSQIRSVAQDEVDLLDFGFVDFKRRRNTASNVQQRRNGDKVAPFVRWAEALTSAVPVQDRLSTVARLFPPGTIGDHAKGHLLFVVGDHFKNPLDLSYSWLFGSTPERPRTGLFISEVLVLLASHPYNLGVLNRAVAKAHAAIWTDPRTLLSRPSEQKPPVLNGVVDVSAYWKRITHVVWRSGEDHPEWQKAVERLVEAWREARYGDTWIDGVFVASAA